MLSLDFQNPIDELKDDDLYHSLKDVLEERYENIGTIISGDESQRKRKSSESLKREFNLDLISSLLNVSRVPVTTILLSLNIEFT